MSEETTAAPAKAGWKKTAGLVLATAVVAAAGGLWWSRSATAQEGGGHEPAPVKESSRGLIKFEPFVVNLADGSGTRFLRTTLQLVVAPAEAAETVGKDPVVMLQVRSAVLELLAQQSSASLVTPEGKAAMKAAIVSRAQEALGDWKIVDVLFSEFVVQF
jgi:flagellar basal body-associated protein FliL